MFPDIPSLDKIRQSVRTSHTDTGEISMYLIEIESVKVRTAEAKVDRVMHFRSLTLIPNLISI